MKSLTSVILAVVFFWLLFSITGDDNILLAFFLALTTGALIAINERD